MAGIPILAAVSAPSSLAVELAREVGHHADRLPARRRLQRLHAPGAAGAARLGLAGRLRGGVANGRKPSRQRCRRARRSRERPRPRCGPTTACARVLGCPAPARPAGGRARRAGSELARSPPCDGARGVLVTCMVPAPPRRRPARGGRQSAAVRAADHGVRWSPPRSWLTTWGSSGPRTASPSRTPPVEPGRLTISVRPAVPARPRESTAVGDAVLRAVPADRLGDARAPRGRARAGSPRG